MGRKPVKKITKLQKKKYLCYDCGEEVMEFDGQVILTTSRNGRIVDEITFHEDCWKDYFNKAVTKRAKQNVENVQKKVMGLMNNPIVKSLLSGVKGSDGVLGMLKTPLTEEKVEEINDDILEDGKRAKSRRKRKTKA